MCFKKCIDTLNCFIEIAFTEYKTKRPCGFNPKKEIINQKVKGKIKAF
jgi:hypothetical protein